MRLFPSTWTVPFARRVRVWSAAGTVCAIALFTVSAHTRGVVRSGKWIAGVSSGCLVAGTEYDYGPGGSGVRWTIAGGVVIQAERTWDAGFAAAWRPFRAGNKSYSRAVVPIWPGMLALGVMTAVAHGVIIGRRTGDPGRCAGCGYDIASLLKRGGREDSDAAPGVSHESGDRGRVGMEMPRCPECGRVATVVMVKPKRRGKAAERA